MLHLEAVTRYHSAADQARIAIELSALASDAEVQTQLRARNRRDVLKGFNDLDAAYKTFSQKYKAMNQRRLGAYVLLDQNDTPQGMAEVLPHATLSRQRAPFIPIPRLFNKGVISKNITVAGPRIAIWTAEPLDGAAHHDTAFTEALRRIMTPGGPAEQAFHRAREHDDTKMNAWLIEPKNAPRCIHNAITQNNFIEQNERRYDDGSVSVLAVPPTSRLYVQELID